MYKNDVRITKVSVKTPEVPVSVVVPLSEKRKAFFENFTLPSLEANAPENIFIVEGNKNQSYKRNVGSKKTDSTYIIFCDDDVILQKNALCTFVNLLEKNRSSSFAYSNFLIVDIWKTFTTNRVTSRPWDPDALKVANYIDTCSLIRKKDLIEFDNNLTKFEDWDMWIRMALQGKKGEYVPKDLFISFCIDQNVTSSLSDAKATEILVQKYRSTT